MKTLSPARSALLIVLIATALRLYSAAMLGLGVDESYMVTIARQLSLSYFDHPPLSFWIIHATTWLTGSESGLVLRLPFILMATVSAWLLFRLTSQLFTETAAVWTLVWFSISPFFLISAGGWIVPDGPLVLLLLIAAHLLIPLALRPGLPLSNHRWALIGGIIGLSILAKYMAVLFGAGLLWFLLARSGNRQEFLRLGPWLAIFVMCLTLTPLIYWNAMNDWQSFAFQLSRSGSADGGSTSFNPENFARFIAGQLVYLHPLPCVAMIWIFIRSLTRRNPLTTGFLLCLAAVPITLFNVVAAVSAQSLPHWSMPGFLFLFPLLGVYSASMANRFPCLIHCSAGLSAMITGALVLIIGAHVRYGILTLHHESTPVWDDTTQAMDWYDLRDAFANKNDPPVVYALNWIEGGKIGFALGDLAKLRVIGTDPRHFGFLPETGQPGETAYVITLLPPDTTTEFRQSATEKARTQLCDIEPQVPLSLTRNGLPYRNFYILRGCIAGPEQSGCP